jgi:hypothetical protein
MNLDSLQQKLLAAARAQPQDDRVPYAFEKRILARLANQPASDRWASWVRGLWRAAASCATLCLLLSAWTLLTPALTGPDDEFSQQFENTVLAAVDHEVEGSW